MIAISCKNQCNMHVVMNSTGKQIEQCNLLPVCWDTRKTLLDKAKFHYADFVTFTETSQWGKLWIQIMKVHDTIFSPCIVTH